MRTSMQSFFWKQQQKVHKSKMHIQLKIYNITYVSCVSPISTNIHWNIYLHLDIPHATRTQPELITSWTPHRQCSRSRAQIRNLISTLTHCLLHLQTQSFIKSCWYYLNLFFSFWLSQFRLPLPLRIISLEVQSNVSIFP